VPATNPETRTIAIKYPAFISSNSLSGLF